VAATVTVTLLLFSFPFS
jgi:hypothetical protein